jgi:sugar transferase (PEP-CTERM/EpsH1 system associated)
MRSGNCEQRPKVLFIAPQPCWPPNTGARLRNYHLARNLASVARVTYLSFTGDEGAVRGNMQGFCDRLITVRRDSDSSIRQLIRGVVGPSPLGVVNYTTGAMTRQLWRLLHEGSPFDIVQIEAGHLAAYIPVIRRARVRPLIVCDWHNVESQVMARYAAATSGLARRLYARRTAWLWRNEERRMLETADAHIAVTERDRDHLLESSENEARVFIVENGVDAGHFNELTGVSGAELTPLRNRIVFVGSMDYHANIDAVVPFARYVWPQLLRRHPGLRFAVIGRNPSPDVCALAQLPGIEVTGTVEDVRPYYRRAIAAVAPLRVGGGSRLKILEAMAAGVPVVSTPIGAEGLEVSDGRNILIAAGANETFARLDGLIDDPQQRWRLAVEARALVKRRYDWASIAQSHRRTLNSILGISSPISPGVLAAAARA